MKWCLWRTEASLWLASIYPRGIRAYSSGVWALMKVQQRKNGGRQEGGSTAFIASLPGKLVQVVRWDKSPNEDRRGQMQDNHVHPLAHMLTIWNLLGDWKMLDMANLDVSLCWFLAPSLFFMCSECSCFIWTLLQLADLEEPREKESYLLQF